MRSSVGVLIGVAAAALAIPAALRAQAVDYAALQETLGEPVTTSVTGKPQRASAAPASITIVTREQIARSPARSVPDLLKTYAGVDVNHWTAGQADVAVRGGVQPYNARLLVLVNGRQVYLDHYGMTDWNLLGVPLDTIQQIELVRGPASALFGFNAASGVVNIITVNPMQRFQIATTAEGGTHGYSRFSGVIAAPIGQDVAVKLSGGHQREDERRIPDAIGSPPSIGDVTVDQVSATIAASPDSMTHVELKGGYADNRQLEFLPTEVLLEQHFRNRTAGVILDHDTPWGSLNAQSYANWLNADYGTTGAPALPRSGLAGIGFRNRIVVAKASSLVRISSADTMRLGVEYRDNQLFSDTLYAPRVGYQNAAIDGMLDLHPNDRVGISLAGRLDHLSLGIGGAPVAPQIDPPSAYDRAMTQASFNAAILVQVGSAGQIRINGGRGLQSPSLIDFGFRLRLPSALAPIPVYALGDPRIAPTTVWSGEIAYAQRLPSGTRIEANAFYTRTDDPVALPSGAAGFQVRTQPDLLALVRFANVGAFETYGASVAANGRIGKAIGWLANYTWTDVHETFPYSEPPFMVSLAPAASTPEHVVNMGLDYGGARWFGAATARFTSSTGQLAFDRDGNVQLFHVRRAIGVDAKIGYHVSRHLDAYAAGENLSSAAGVAGSPIPADRRVRVGVNYTL